MVEDLVSACPGLAGFALQPVPLGPVCVDVLAPNMREATSLCCRKSAPLWGDFGGAEPAKCLTTGDIAKQAVFLGGRLLANMKATFVPSWGSRTLLLEGIVLELIGEPVVENRTFDELVGLQDARGTLILHVGLQYLKPFRPTFLVVVPGEASPDDPSRRGPQVRPGEK